MSQRLFRTTSLATLGLLFAAGGFVAVACGSDKSTQTGNDPLNPGANNGGSDNTPGAGGSAEPGTTDPDNTPGVGATGGGTTSNEGQGGEVSVDPDPPATNGGGANPDNPPDPPVGLAPNCGPAEGDVPNLALELVATGLNDPIYVTGVPGDDTRLMIMEKPGVIRIVQDGQLVQQPFLDFSGQVQNGGEQGALGLAFHPSYATNGLFYVHYSSNASQGLPPTGDTVVAEFQVDANNRSVANLASRRIVLTIDQPQGNHNGGQITFGADGMLYLGFGDGGGQNDNGQGDQQQAARPGAGNGQSLNVLLGKILRIDPLGRETNNAYSIPPGNLAELTQQAQTRQEVWAYGLRNPWRFSFDPCNGDLYIGDVGQNTNEEVDYVRADATTRSIAAGTNFGWRTMEAQNCFQAANCTQTGLTLPVDSYARGVGVSVTGGYVYRGSAIPGLRGTYIYADYESVRFFRFRMQDGTFGAKQEITDQLQPPAGEDSDIASFGTDNAGEMYIAAFNDNQPGAVYRIVAEQ